MALAKIKKEHIKQVVAFGKSAAPLSERDDLDELAILAIESGDKLLLSYFEELPTLDILKKSKTDKELGRNIEANQTATEPKQTEKKK